MTQEELKRLEALANAATPGPWYDNDIALLDGNDGESYPAYLLNPDNAEIDAAFIAAARDAVPALVAEVRVLQKAVELAAYEFKTQHSGTVESQIAELLADARKELEGA